LLHTGGQRAVSSGRISSADRIRSMRSQVLTSLIWPCHNGVLPRQRCRCTNIPHRLSSSTSKWITTEPADTAPMTTSARWCLRHHESLRQVSTVGGKDHTSRQGFELRNALRRFISFCKTSSISCSDIFSSWFRSILSNTQRCL